MSRLAIKNLLGPAKLHLDLGCTQLILQNGKSATSLELSAPLKSGKPESDSYADLRTKLMSLCAAIAPGKRKLEISLSDALARSWIVERLPGLASVQEIEALAGDQMRRLYGDNNADSADWVIRLDTTPFVSRWPAIALPKWLLDLLVEIAVTQGWQLTKIQTRFVQRLNAERSNSLHRPKCVVYSLDTPDGLTRTAAGVCLHGRTKAIYGDRWTNYPTPENRRNTRKTPVFMTNGIKIRDRKSVV